MPYSNPNYEKYDRIIKRFHQAVFENPKLNWLRWILLLPAACIAFYIPFILFGIVNSFYEPAEWFRDYAEGIPADFAGLIFYILVGVYIAPRQKKNVALLLMILFLLLAGAGIFIALANKSYLKIIFIVASVLGSIVGYKIVLAHDWFLKA